MQEAAREQDKLVRQARAKQQRAETDVKSAKQAVAQLAGQVQQLEELTAKKDLQLDAAVQQARVWSTAGCWHLSLLPLLCL